MPLSISVTTASVWATHCSHPAIALLRVTSKLEPLTSAGHRDLAAPLRDLITALLTKP